MAEYPLVTLGRWVRALLGVPSIMRTWQAAAAACGLTGLERRGLGLSLEGRLEGMSVILQVGTRGSTALTSIRVGGIVDLDVVQFGAARDGLPDVHDRPVVLTGDVAFDREFQLHGDLVAIQAVFDAPARQALRRLFTGDTDVPRFARSTEHALRATLARGELRVEVPGDGADWLREMLAQTLDLARRLSRPAEIVAALARNAAQDPEPGVRLQNLLRLIEDYPRHAATRPILQAACADEREEVRLEAALALGGDEGRAVLRALAAGAKDEACAARALRGLGEDLDPAELLAFLDAALEGGRWQVAEEGVDGLRGRGGAPALARLERALRVETRGVALAAARALARPPAPGAEDLLLRLGLTHSSSDVAVAAAVALGLIGTAASVLPLREAGRRRGGELEAAALQAVGDIQVRLGDALPGQLSLAVGESGALSIAPDTGQVSLPPERDLD